VETPESKWTWFKEVPGEEVPAEARAAVRQTGGYAAFLLGVPPFVVKWIRPETDEEAERHKAHGRDADSIHHDDVRELRGLAEYPDKVWIRFGLAPLACRSIVLHEVYHLAQMMFYPHLRRRCTCTEDDDALMEADARWFQEVYYKAFRRAGFFDD
jgi:hypothetical protein